MADEVVQRFEFTRLDMATKRTTPEGGIIVRARIARTGILEYQNADGTTRRELRLPDDVYAQDALDSFANATVTDLHHGLITPLNWREHTIGNLAGAPVQDGEYVAADVLVRDAKAIRKVESGESKEVSCGYQCKIDPTPGVHPKYGKFDCRQYGIVGNHVAVGPPGWGRSGSSVALRLDGNVAASWLEGGTYVPPKMGEEKKDPPANPSPPATKQDDAELRGRNAALEAENKRLRDEAQQRADESKSQEAQERNDAAIEARVALIEDARPHLDAKDKPWSHKDKTDDAIRREVLAKLEPGLPLPEPTEDGADGFVRGAFGAAVSRATRATAALKKTVLASPRGGRADTKKPTTEERRNDATEGSGNLIADAADTQKEKLKGRWNTKKNDKRGAR